MNDGSGYGAWFEHLTEADLNLLARVASPSGERPADVRTEPAALGRLLFHPATFEAVFGEPQQESLVPTSPFLIFALIVHRASAELQEARHVAEWVGPRQRLPVLGGDDLREFLSTPQRRLFLTELLASYTRVTSGSTWVRTSRGWRRRRFSELDPVRLASLLEVVPKAEQAGVYRRLGDLALFLTGVFPDHTEMYGLGPIDEGRLMRLSDVTPEDAPHSRSLGPGSAGSVDVLQRLGERWYQRATRTAWGPLSGTMPVVAEVAGCFAVARRTLNYLTDRHLFTRRAGWFGEPAS